MALMVWDSKRCTSCGNYDSLDPQGSTGYTVTSPDGRVFEVLVYRCLTCAVEKLARRKWDEEHKNDPATNTGALVSDGLMFVAQPQPEEDR